MKKFLLSLFFIVFTTQLFFAQRDTEHWFAPYFDTSNSSYNHALYFSTDSVTPFDVKIYNNNIQIGTVTISKGNPQTFTVTASFIKTSTATNAASVRSMGIYTQGTSPYYVSLRIYSFSHGEIVTSKGKAGIGTEFYAAGAPLTSAGLGNFTTSVLATEDNTDVTVTGYNSNVSFINLTPTPTSVTFTLNKGQSYILAGDASATNNNFDGFIGAKIVSTKPISVTNGNSNGFYATTTFVDGSDLILDQSVPTTRLGKTFAMVRSISTNSDNMEGGVIVATKPNTQVFLNGATTPVATLNEGDYYRILDASYIEQGAGSGHFNIFVSTSENVYLYQLVGSGDAGNTGGYNYIPPLNCFLPNKIDEIGKINEMPTYTGSLTLKLNILTQTGAVVTVNGTAPTAAQGPFPLTGTTEWVTYAIPNPTGNLTILSNKAVTAGINGGYGTAGYGGYFAGFSSVPVIGKQTGVCVPGIVLEVDDSYESYQWFLNGVAIPGATANSYTPSEAGNYTVKVTVNACQPLTTIAYKVFSCLKETTTAISACGKVEITPTFSSSTQAPLPATVQILTLPTNGTATLNPTTGKITYIPNVGYVGPDTMVYKFCGNAPEFVDCEQVTLDFNVVPFEVTDATLEACIYNNAPTANFNLEVASVTTSDPVTKQFFRSMADLTAGFNEITNPQSFQSAGGKVYVLVTTPEGCKDTAEITLIVKPISDSPLLVDQILCAESRTNIDAGPGYESYQWSNGETTSSLQGVGVGVYTVVLGKNGCFVTQTVIVRKAPDPVISDIEILNDTATILVKGGTPPYQYAVDTPTNWQNENVFTNLSRGQHTFFVKDAYNCTPLMVELTVPNFINAITPNGDNINDILDYSALAYKRNLRFAIYDRYGNRVFYGTRFNNFKWDGTMQGKKLPTGNYWYRINWTENNEKQTNILQTGWILLKNKD